MSEHDFGIVIYLAAFRAPTAMENQFFICEWKNQEDDSFENLGYNLVARIMLSKNK